MFIIYSRTNKKVECNCGAACSRPWFTRPTTIDRLVANSSIRWSWYWGAQEIYRSVGKSWILAPVPFRTDLLCRPEPSDAKRLSFQCSGKWRRRHGDCQSTEKSLIQNKRRLTHSYCHSRCKYSQKSKLFYCRMFVDSRQYGTTSIHLLALCAQWYPSLNISQLWKYFTINYSVITQSLTFPRRDIGLIWRPIYGPRDAVYWYADIVS